LYIITKCTNHMLEKLTENSFLSKRAAIITSNQSKEIISKIYGICNKLKIVPFISEHFHYSYIKYNTGINMDYSYLSFTLALNSSEIFSLMKIDKSANHSFPKVKIYDAIFYKVALPTQLQVKITLDNKYYTKIIEKYNVRFFCNSVKTASAASEISEWFSRNSKPKNVKICIFHMSPSLELIDIVNNLCTNKYNSVYIIDYDEIGFNYRSLVYLHKYNTIPESNSNWTETVYESFSRKVNRNITIDNPTSVIDWIFKYSGLHEDTQFDVLCTGSKKMIDDIISKIN